MPSAASWCLNGRRIKGGCDESAASAVPANVRGLRYLCRTCVPRFWGTASPLGPIPAPLASYTPEQATRGRTLYAAQCGNCHGKNLGGSEFATPLNGTAFSLNWGGKSAESLFTFIRTRMPPTAIGSLTPDATAGWSPTCCRSMVRRRATCRWQTDATALAALRVPA